MAAVSPPVKSPLIDFVEKLPVIFYVFKIHLNNVVLQNSEKYRVKIICFY